MLEKIRKSNLAFWLCGIVPFIVMFVMQIPFGKLYLGQWNNALALLVAFVIGLSIIVFGGWATVFLTSPEISTKKFLVTWLSGSFAALLLYFLPLCLISYLKVGWLGFYVGLGILVLMVLPVLLLVLVGGNKVDLKKPAAIAFCAIYILIYCMGIGYAASIKTDAIFDVVKDFYIQDTLSKGTGEKVKVILLNGQSNASGVSSVEYLRKNADEADFARYTAGYDNVMINYFCDNGANSSGGAFVHAAAGQGCNGQKKYFGPELGIADKLSALYPGETIYIIKYSWGGSNLHTQWLSPSSDGETGYMYEAFVNFTRGCLDYLKSKNYDPEIVAMCWMQGESDSVEKKIANAYGERSVNLINDVRTEFADYAAADGIYFIDAGISNSKYWTYYEITNAAKKANAQTQEKYVYLDTIAEGLDYTQEPVESPDLAHYDALSMIKLGNMFAEEIAKAID